MVNFSAPPANNEPVTVKSLFDDQISRFYSQMNKTIELLNQQALTIDELGALLSEMNTIVTFGSSSCMIGRDQAELKPFESSMQSAELSLNSTTLVINTIFETVVKSAEPERFTLVRDYATQLQKASQPTTDTTEDGGDFGGEFDDEFDYEKVKFDAEWFLGASSGIHYPTKLKVADKLDPELTKRLINNTQWDKVMLK